MVIEDAIQAQALFPRWEIVRYLDAVVPWPYPADGARTFYETVVLPAMERGEAWHWSIRLRDAPDELVGTINLKRGERENRGFWVALPWQRRGIATEACAAVNDFWFDVLGFSVLRVGKAIANEASRRISARQGMRLVGTELRDLVSGRQPGEIWEIS
ncbi:MAG TPA: GNAT family N-acetyltransferase, partial [Anaeromyxobacteraceae bacterium]|nr:GNAT family N-acetyltransferase [Anaeromyxobacteraceae bacterium]